MTYGSTMRTGYAAALMALLALTGCGGSSEGPAPRASTDDADGLQGSENTVVSVDRGEFYKAQPAGEPVDGDWIVMRLGADPPTLNPILDTSDASASVIAFGHIFESLMERDNETLELKPHIAESYTISEDKLTYTFTLRKDVTFSDGKPLTAHDVKFTLDTIQNPENETADLRNYYQDVESAEVVDDYTIRFQCSKPYFRHLIMLGGLPIFPKHIYGTESINTHPNNRHPIGSGPFVFEKWDTNQLIVVARNESYWNPDRRPHVAKIVRKIIPDDNAAFSVLEQQNLDLMGLSPEQWTTRASLPDFNEKFDRYQYWAPTGYLGSYSYIGWNMRKPPFDDARVRRAMTLLLDRELILETIYYDLGEITTGPGLAGTAEYNDAVEPWPFDPARAQALLAEAGWADTNNDGILDKDGNPFRFEFVIRSSAPETEQMATVYQEELKRAGIDMVIRPLEWATLIETITKRTFDAVTLGWAIPVDSDPYQVWHSTQTEQGSNYPGFKNDEVDRLLEEARVTFDREERIKMYHRFHEIVHEEQPYTFLFNSPSLVAIDKRFENVSVYQQGLDYLEWWVPVDKQRYK